MVAINILFFSFSPSFVDHITLDAKITTMSSNVIKLNCVDLWPDDEKETKKNHKTHRELKREK